MLETADRHRLLGHLVDAADAIRRAGTVLLAAALGAVLARSASCGSAPRLRTNTLIAVGSAASHARVDPHGENGRRRSPRASCTSSLASAFSAGAILRGGTGDIRGLTTAATVWVNAAIGMACGAGFYSLAITSTLVTLFVLTAFLRVEDYINRCAQANEDPCRSSRPRAIATRRSRQA